MIGSNLSGIRFTGLASGVDTEAIIQRLLQIEQQPLQRLLIRQAKLEARLSAYDQFKGRLVSLQTAAGALASSGAFNLVRAASSDESVVTATASPNAAIGIYQIAVRQLAQAHKVISQQHTSADAELGLSGSFLINGKPIEVVSADNLNSIASKINSAGAGVTASVIHAGEGQLYLSLTASQTGALSKIHLSDVGAGTVLPALKLVSATEVIRNRDGNSALSDRFTDANTAIGSLLGMTTPTNGTIQINGVGIAIDFATDSLTTIAQKINSAGVPDVSASIAAETQNGQTFYRLKITGATTLPTFTDDRNVLKNLGVLQLDYANQLVAAQDANFSVDGITFQRNTNQIGDVISGVTFTLLGADLNNPKQATLTLSRDTEAIKRNIGDFVNAFNAMVDFLKEQTAFDKETFQAGQLFGDVTAANIHDRLVRILTDTIPGLEGQLKALAQVGIMLGEDSKLKLDDAALSSALSGDPNAVGRLFYSAGSTTNPYIQFISATAKTLPSTGTGYRIEITQVATQATATAGVAQTTASSQEERLTFNGKLFNDQPYTLLIPAGSTIDDTITRINNDPTLKDRVVASKDQNGRLVIQARNYGSDSNFTVVSDLAAASNNSGIGTTLLEANGQDVQGTINGEPATGKGQFLTGNSGNPNTEGLQIRVLATTPGTYGSVKFSRGAADAVRNYIQSATDFLSGELGIAQDAIQEEMDALKEQMEKIQERVAQKELDLRRQFSQLESTISRLQAQSLRLSSMLSNSTTTLLQGR